MNEMGHRQEKTNIRFSQHLQDFSSYADKVDQQFQAVSDQLNRTTQALTDYFADYFQVFAHYVRIEANVTQIVMRAEAQSLALLNGVTQLLHNQLSPSIISLRELARILSDVDVALSEMNVPFRVAQKSAQWYYSHSKVISLYSDHSLYISFNIPIVPQNSDEEYELYRVHRFPVPVQKDSTVLTRLLTDVDYIAVSKDRSRYLEISHQELSSCSDHDLRYQCPLMRATKPSHEPSCLMTLFKKELDDVPSVCNFEAFERREKYSEVLEINPGTVLIVNITDIVALNSDRSQARYDGCSYCIIADIKCGTSLLLDDQILPPRITGCGRVGEMTTIDLPNFAIFQRFHSVEDLATAWRKGDPKAFKLPESAQIKTVQQVSSILGIHSSQQVNALTAEISPPDDWLTDQYNPLTFDSYDDYLHVVIAILIALAPVCICCYCCCSKRFIPFAKTKFFDHIMSCAGRAGKPENPEQRMRKVSFSSDIRKSPSTHIRFEKVKFNDNGQIGEYDSNSSDSETSEAATPRNDKKLQTIVEVDEIRV